MLLRVFRFVSLNNKMQVEVSKSAWSPCCSRTCNYRNITSSSLYLPYFIVKNTNLIYHLIYIVYVFFGKRSYSNFLIDSYIKEYYWREKFNEIATLFRISKT